MNRRQFIKGAVAVPLTIAAGAGVAREALYGQSIAERMVGHQYELSRWQRQVLDEIRANAGGWMTDTVHLNIRGTVKEP